MTIAVTGWDSTNKTGSVRGEVEGWSRKSRLNFQRVIADLDYSRMINNGVLGMVTLTYPGRDSNGRDTWADFAPSAAKTTTHLRALRRAVARHYGEDAALAIWKREFQGRGAPHFHILMARPHGVTLQGWRAWVAATWSRIIGRGVKAEPEVIAKHLRVGTAVDEKEGARMRDPKRIAVYFLKHGSGEAKEYQHCVPGEWGGKSGRFWGVWGLKAETATAEICDHDQVKVKRLCRRYEKSAGFRSGAQSSRRVGFYQLHNDAPRFLSQVMRYLNSSRECDCYEPDDYGGG